MGLSNLSFSATNINAGNDADKPSSPKAGDIYIATDTNKVYVCYNDGTWRTITVVHPIITSGEYVGVIANTMQTLVEYTINFDDVYTLIYTPYSPGGGVGYLDYEITKNDSEVITSGSINNYTTVVTANDVSLESGDTIQFRSEGYSGNIYRYPAKCKDVQILQSIQTLVATKV